MTCERFEREQARRAERALRVEREAAHVQDNTDVRAASGKDGVDRDTLHDSHTIERTLGFESANANFELAGLNATNNICDVVNGIRTLEEVDECLGLTISATQPFTLRRHNLRRQRVRVGFNEQVARVRRRDFGNVELLVERLSDAVQDGERSLRVDKIACIGQFLILFRETSSSRLSKCVCSEKPHCCK